MAPAVRRGGPSTDVQKYFLLSSWEVLLPALATIIVVLRIYLRRRYKIALGWDDLMIIAAVPFVWASWLTFYMIYASVSPAGTAHIQPERVPLLLLWIFANVEVSVTAVNFIKFSIIFFFMRAFGTTRRTQVILWIILIANVLYGLVRFGIVFTICIPVSNFWNNPTACKSDQHMYWIVISIIGVVLEFIMLIFPLPFIWRLKVPLERKLAVSAVFALAAGVVLACALRIWFFFQAPNFVDHIFKDRNAGVLHLMQELENNFGILVACLPAMHSPLRSLINSWRGKIRAKKSPLASNASRSTPPQSPSSPRSPKGVFDFSFGTVLTTVDADAERSLSLIPFESHLFKPPVKADVQVRETKSDD